MLQPIGRKILVKPVDEGEEKRPSGLVVPIRYDETGKVNMGEVLAVGGLVDVIAVGDVVVYPHYQGMPVKDGDDNLVILNQEDVIAKYSAA